MKKRILGIALSCVLLCGCSLFDTGQPVGESSMEEGSLLVESSAWEEESQLLYIEEQESQGQSSVEEDAVVSQPRAESSAPSSKAGQQAQARPESSVAGPVVSQAAPKETPQIQSGAASPSGGTQLQGAVGTNTSGEDMSGVSAEIIRLINQERARLGLGTLTYDAKLTQGAAIRSREMYRNNYFAHTRPNGAGWQTVLQQDVPITYRSAGENLARVEHNMPDYDPAQDPQYWYDTWEGSPGHYENMVKPEFTHVGVSIHYQVKNDMVVAVATTLFASY